MQLAEAFARTRRWMGTTANTHWDSLQLTGVVPAVCDAEAGEQRGGPPEREAGDPERRDRRAQRARSPADPGRT